MRLFLQGRAMKREADKLRAITSPSSDVNEDPGKEKPSFGPKSQSC